MDSDAAANVSHLDRQDGGSNAAAGKGKRWHRQCRAVKPGGAAGAGALGSQPKAAQRGRPGQNMKQRLCGGGNVAIMTKALIMGSPSHWFALLEGRKLFELRRHAVNIPCGGLRVLLICSRKMRDRYGLSLRMAEGMCYRRLGPLSAESIIKSPYLRGGVLASDAEIRKLLPARAGRQTRGYLYCLVGVRMSQMTWSNVRGNGSNCQSFFDRFCGDQPRWTEK